MIFNKNEYCWTACLETHLGLIGPVAPVSLRWCESSLMTVTLGETVPCSPSLPKPFIHLIDQMKAYMNGEKIVFQCTVNLSRYTPFQQHVLETCRKIPYGSSCSYTELAQLAGYPCAMRAVGNAMAKNPVPIVIPCHRILRSNGSLGGYSAGLSWKTSLLTLEEIAYT
jgi:O-6-methylguanine DNA methyltransferase